MRRISEFIMQNKDRKFSFKRRLDDEEAELKIKESLHQNG